MLALARESTTKATAGRRIFNHDIMGCTAEGVKGNHLYSGRALGMTEPGDLIQLHPDLKPQWPFIAAHYDRVGLSFTDRVIWETDPRGLAEHPDHQVSVFYFGSREQQARPDDDWYLAVDHINSKNNFMKLAENLGVPVPLTRCYQDVSDIREAHITGICYPCYIKAAVSVSGVGIYRCADDRALRDVLPSFEAGTQVQIQAEVSTDLFLNLQYKADAHGIHRYAATEQLLDGPAHIGNRHPARHEPWDCVEPMAEWLQQQGIRGIYAFDIAVIETPEGPDYLAIECNPRYNGASYPTAIARKLGISDWTARIFETDCRSLAYVDLAGLEYDAHLGEGIVLVNWGPVLVGKLLFLLAGSQRVQAELAAELERRLR